MAVKLKITKFGTLKFTGDAASDSIISFGPLISFNGGSTISPVGLTDLVQVVGKGGDDTVNFAGSFFISDINGGSGDDRLIGGELDDLIKGGKGDDVIRGEGGDDDLRGQAGDDTIRGNAGNDSIKGGGGEDSVLGGNGDDLIDGGGKDDTLSGGDDNDTITGGSGNDSINGDDGNDSVDGGTGNDIVRGGDGNDTLDDTSGGVDSVVGGQGRDLYLVGDGTSGDTYDLNDPTGSANEDIVRVMDIPGSGSPEVDTILGFDAVNGDGEVDQVDLTQLGKTFVSVQGFAGNGRIDIYNTAGELAHHNPSYSLIMDDPEEASQFLVGNFPGANVRVVTGTTVEDEFGIVTVI